MYNTKITLNAHINYYLIFSSFSSISFTICNLQKTYFACVTVMEILEKKKIYYLEFIDKMYLTVMKIVPQCKN